MKEPMKQCAEWRGQMGGPRGVLTLSGGNGGAYVAIETNDVGKRAGVSGARKLVQPK